MNGAACTGFSRLSQRIRKGRMHRQASSQQGSSALVWQNSGRLEARVETEEWGALCSLGCRYCMTLYAKLFNHDWTILNDNEYCGTCWGRAVPVGWGLSCITTDHYRPKGQSLWLRGTDRCRQMLVQEEARRREEAWQLTDPGKSSGAGYAESDQSGLVGSDASVMMPFQVQKEERRKRAEQRRTTAFFIRMHPQVESCFFAIWYIDRLNLAICQITFGKDIFCMNLLAKSFRHPVLDITWNTVVLRLWSYGHVDKKGFYNVSVKGSAGAWDSITL